MVLCEGRWEMTEPTEVLISLTDYEEAPDPMQPFGDLRLALLELDVDGVELVADSEPPDGAKSIGALVGGLLVRLGKVVKVQVVVKLAREWATRTDRTVRVSIGGDELVVTGANTAQQDRIIEAWLARHQ
jgi:hypothetical protein